MTAHTSPEKPSADVAALWAAGGLGKRMGGVPEIIFAQVREDAAVEVAALATCQPPEVAFCIGSGGCTAFSLLTGAPAALYVLDINPAQVYLLEIKKAALERLAFPEMLGCMTSDARPAYPELRPLLSPEASAFWDRRPHLLALGLNHCGLIERKLRWVTRRLLPLWLGRRRLETLFRQTDLTEQHRFYRTTWDNWRWKALFRGALSRPVLRLAYGSRFLAQLPAGFPQLMKQQVDAAFREFPIQENGYLWQTFLGRYPPAERGLPIYLRREQHARIQAGMARIHLACDDAAAWLMRQPRGSIRFFALSNILEVTTSEYAARLAAAIEHAAKPGALVCVRSIFPPGASDLCRYSERLAADDARSKALARLNRSPFCAFIQVFRVEP
jgi:S-adenosylmethionine-diacylglycerol 3-amino-3-carboxypropyl transferase